MHDDQMVVAMVTRCLFLANKLHSVQHLEVFVLQFTLVILTTNPFA